MKRFFIVAVAIACSVTVPATSHAQTCAGSASFSNGAVRIGAAATFNDGTDLYGGGVAVGSAHGAFVTVNAGQISYSNVSGKSTEVGASLGYGISVGSTAEFCPLVAYTHTSFPDEFAGATRITSGENDFGFGGTFGVVAKASSTADFVPFAALQYVHAAFNTTFGGLGSSSGSQDYGLLGLGVGMVINKIVTFQPSVSIPFGLAGSKAAVNIGLSLNFGHIAHD